MPTCSSSLAALSSPFTSELASLRSDAAAESKDAENSRMIWSDTCWELHAPAKQWAPYLFTLKVVRQYRGQWTIKYKEYEKKKKVMDPQKTKSWIIFESNGATNGCNLAAEMAPSYRSARDECVKNDICLTRKNANLVSVI